ncbi:MAG: hypothetical protein OXE77_00115 [Flavobacteriaceae bacterium]|nr:hypothetical protein [Flavobacteriaceae bacterium]MCY4267002.1 hypothetical protein [Flavobacteriaceae bacterium]
MRTLFIAFSILLFVGFIYSQDQDIKVYEIESEYQFDHSETFKVVAKVPYMADPQEIRVAFYHRDDTKPYQSDTNTLIESLNFLLTEIPLILVQSDIPRLLTKYNQGILSDIGTQQIGVNEKELHSIMFFEDKSFAKGYTIEITSEFGKLKAFEIL